MHLNWPGRLLQSGLREDGERINRREGLFGWPITSHEMLAEVLLLSHNQHVFLAFLHAIRRAIIEDRLQEYTEGFRRARLASI